MTRARCRRFRASRPQLAPASASDDPAVPGTASSMIPVDSAHIAHRTHRDHAPTRSQTPVRHGATSVRRGATSVRHGATPPRQAQAGHGSQPKTRAAETADVPGMDGLSESATTAQARTSGSAAIPGVAEHQSTASTRYQRHQPTQVTAPVQGNEQSAGVHRRNRARCHRHSAEVRCPGGGDDRAGYRRVRLGSESAGNPGQQPVRDQGRGPGGQRLEADSGVRERPVGHDQRGVPGLQQRRPEHRRSRRVARDQRVLHASDGGPQQPGRVRQRADRCLRDQSQLRQRPHPAHAAIQPVPLRRLRDRGRGHPRQRPGEGHRQARQADAAFAARAHADGLRVTETHARTLDFAEPGPDADRNHIPNASTHADGHRRVHADARTEQNRRTAANLHAVRGGSFHTSAYSHANPVHTSRGHTSAYSPRRSVRTRDGAPETSAYFHADSVQPRDGAPKTSA